MVKRKEHNYRQKLIRQVVVSIFCQTVVFQELFNLDEIYRVVMQLLVIKISIGTHKEVSVLSGRRLPIIAHTFIKSAFIYFYKVSQFY